MLEENKPVSPSESDNDGMDRGDAKDSDKKSYNTNVTGNVGTGIQAEHSTIINTTNITNIFGEHRPYNTPLPEDVRKKQERYRVGASDPAFTPDEETNVAAKAIPVSDSEFNQWFYTLNDYEQCFVLAMAVFYGAAVHVVVAAAQQLYTPLRESEKQQQKKQEQASAESIQRTPRTELLKRLYITSRRISGTDRLYWQDTDPNNDSEFSTRLLLYIAREASFGFGAQEGQIFNQQLLAWVNDKNEDVAWRAARALGVSWWQNHTNEIGDTVNLWARSDNDFDWHRAAWSLDGAYKIDKINYKDVADDVRKSPVLKKLRRWVIKARNKQNVNLGSIAAITYAFLGRSSPQVGMRGLDTLLELPKTELEQDYEELETLSEIYKAAVFSYRDLALSGRVREVLQHQASYIKNTCYDRVHLNMRDREERYRREIQRKLRIGAAFDVLYWIAEASFANLRDTRSVSYQLKGTLPVRPTFENKQGRELLLEGILREEEKEWRNHISTLLCAAFIERNTQLPFILLRGWAELVMRDQSTHPDDVRKSYVRFMRDLAIQTDTWCHHLQKNDFHVPQAVNTFTEKLTAWKLESRRYRMHGYVPIDLLAQEVLDELPFVNGNLVPSMSSNKVL